MYKRFTLILVVLCNFLNPIFAHDISFNTTSPEGIHVCADSEIFYVEFTNNSDSEIVGSTINIDFPTGITYAGDLSETSNFNIQELDISNVSSIKLSIDNISANGVVSFSFKMQAGFDAIAFQQAGNTFRNMVTVNRSNGESETNESDTYNLLFPALSIINVDEMSQRAFVGESFTRSVTIVNGGYGKLSSFILKDIYDANLELLATDIGQFNAVNSEIILSTTDFQNIGNGDIWFDQNEMITITETVKAVGCNSTQTQLVTTWSCDNQASESNSKYPYTTIQLFTPQLDVTSNPSFNTCVDGSPDEQQLIITNNGDGPAYNTQVDLYQFIEDENYEDIFSRIDENSLSYSINGGSSISIAVDQSFVTSSDGSYNCLGSNPKGRVIATLPEIGPGDNIVLTWNSYTCDTDYCGQVDLIGWRYQLNYEDACQSANFTEKGIGQDPKEKNLSVFVENPADLVDGQTGTYTFIISSATFNLPQGTDPYFEAVFKIPDGLTWSGNAADLTYVSGITEWPASNINFNNSTKLLTVQYAFPIPFNLSRSEFKLNLTADCSALGYTSGSVNVGMQLFYVMDVNCSNPYRMPLTCYESPITFIHCLGNCSEGMAFQSFVPERISFGQSDNDLDGLPDTNSNLNFNAIKLNRVMVGDTFKTTFKGVVKTSAAYPNWEYGYATSVLPYGDKLTLIDASISVYDASTGNTITCNQINLSASMSNGVLSSFFDYSIATLVANGCSDFTGFQFEEGDEVTLIPRYKVTGNIGGNVEQVTITNSFYLSDIAAPTHTANKFQCNNWAGNLTIIGYYFTTAYNNNYKVNSCTKTVAQNFYLSIGNCCTNYGGGDLFPREYRNWANIKELTVTIPDGYEVESMYMDQYRTRYTNSTIKETQNPIAPVNVNGGIYTFDLEQYLVSNGGNINLSDDGFHGTVFLDLRPSCDNEQAVNEPLVWEYNFRKVDFLLGGGITSNYVGQDQLRYNRANLSIATPLQTQDGISPTVSWEVTIKNTSTKVKAENAWLHFYAPSLDINVLEVLDLSDNTVVAKDGEFYRMSTINKSKSNTYKITASYDRCVMDELIVMTGYDCNGYPNIVGDIACEYTSYSLFTNPQPAEMQVKIEGSTNEADPCDGVISTEIEILSSKLGNIKDVFVIVNVPSSNSILLGSGSAMVEYPISSGYHTVGTPDLTDHTYTFTSADIDSIIATDGLVGVTNVAANKVRLKFDLMLQANFQVGDKVVINVGSKKSCGDDLPTIVLNYDPNAVFGRTTGIGLDEKNDSWGMAWGDYNNDDYPDLFVTNYNPDEGSKLYHNNGDGSFSEVTTGIHMTPGPSLASSWGDYDNDGDLDIFVTYNIGSKNVLARNNGDGTFTCVQNDPIVNYDGYSHGASWGDYDNDGYLDMFVAEYYSTRFNLLYHNNGDGTFTQNTTSAISLEASSSIAGIWGDIDNDGDIDLFVSNNNENNSLYKNEGNGNFEKVETGIVVTDGGKSVGASFGDIDNDGDLDLFVANAGNENNFLYTNDGTGYFTKVTTGVIVNNGGHSHGSSFGDYDNDGDLDLIVTNNNGQNNFLYSNNGDGTFSSIDNEITSDGGDSFGTGWADFDLDGDLDLFIANHGETEDFFYENERGKCYNDACLILVGTNANESAIGAKISVKANLFGQDEWQTRFVTGQAGGGIGGQNELKQHFGMGDASQIDSIIIEWPSGYIQHTGPQSVNDCITIVEENGSELCGQIYYDENENCQYDEGEALIPYARLEIKPIDKIIFTDENGNYSINLPVGEYTISMIADDNWEVSCVDDANGKTVGIVNNGAVYCGNNFGVQSKEGCFELPDLSISLGTTALRVGFESLYAVSFSNKGTAPATDVQVEVDFGNYIIATNSSLPWDSISENVYFWNIDRLDIGQQMTIYVEDSISVNATIGDSTTVVAGIHSDIGDCRFDDNIFQETSEFVGAIDPNDILVSPKGRIEPTQELTYKIRFQNIGNASVSTVVITDQLPDELDIETLKMGSVSHPFKLSIEDNGTLVWRFENINLPDSLSNEPESHGFINFKITPKAGVMDGMTIENEATIYFDNAAPLKTNTVANIIVKKVIGEPGALSITPNPMHVISDIRIVPKNINEAYVDVQSIYIYDALGRIVFKERNTDKVSIRLNEGDIDKGYYIVKVIGADGNEYIGKLLVL